MKKFIVIYGPTGSGKTDLSLYLSKYIPVEIINGDVGQLYEPLSIGTAKPDIKNMPVAHHFFGIIDEPKHCTVVEYRSMLLEKFSELWKQHKIPVLVGGSGFYLKSLFFPPLEFDENQNTEVIGSWDDLFLKDSKRAMKIHKNDHYRIHRALTIASSNLPSLCLPTFKPFPGKGLFIFVKRDIKDLYQRINFRTELMIKQGWIAEVESLLDTVWEQFLLEKKIIGYDTIIHFLKESKRNEQDYQLLVQTIAKKTRNYAKRQHTFWRMLKKLLESNDVKESIVPLEISVSDSEIGISFMQDIIDFCKIRGVHEA